jgi:hypothetical protein
VEFGRKRYLITSPSGLTGKVSSEHALDLSWICCRCVRGVGNHGNEATLQSYLVYRVVFFHVSVSSADSVRADVNNASAVRTLSCRGTRLPWLYVSVLAAFLDSVSDYSMCPVGETHTCH